MSDWNKEADWLPLSNASAQVQFWKQDLKQAEDQLAYVESFRRYNLSGFNKMYEEALEDVKESQIGLRNARDKLAETLKRLESRKE
jgi:hypothetical protein